MVKYIHPTRYRQIVETTSAERLTREEQEIISEDQKHSSTVAKIHYKKKQSRTIALQGKQCMDKMIGKARNDSNDSISGILNELQMLNSKFDDSVINQSADILQQNTSISSHITSAHNTVEGGPITSSQLNQSSCGIGIETSPYKDVSSPMGTSKFAEKFMLQATDHLLTNDRHTTSSLDSVSQIASNNSNYLADFDMVVTKTIVPNSSTFERKQNATNFKDKVGTSMTAKQEVAAGQFKQTPKNTKFTNEEDEFLSQGIQKYGKGHWAAILKDRTYKFHNSRTRDSLRMRAESIAFKKKLF